MIEGDQFDGCAVHAVTLTERRPPASLLFWAAVPATVRDSSCAYHWPEHRPS
jgi:hypothetical protein